MRKLLIGVAILVVAAGAAVVLTRDDDAEDPFADCGDPALDAPVAEPAGDGPPVSLEPVGFAGSYVTALAEHPDGRVLFLLRDGRLVQRAGFDGADETLLELDPAIEAERGALGLAIAPDGARVYLTYTPDDRTNVLVEYALTATGIDAASERLLLEVENLEGQHMMNNVAFGPDGFLYVGLGDTGIERGLQAETPVALDPADLRGKVLRIDPAAQPDGAPYGVPADNPFVDDPDAAGEVFALGLRNPWRFSFDRATGDLWIGDVGENCGEEIDLVAAGDAGLDFGWATFEAAYRHDGPDVPDAVDPALWYPRVTDGDAVRCAVIGGFVYRGEAIPDLAGRYVFGDLCSPALHAVDMEATDPEVTTIATLGEGQLLGFAEDAAGELYALTTDGVSRLAPG